MEVALCRNRRSGGGRLERGAGREYHGRFRSSRERTAGGKLLGDVAADATVRRVVDLPAEDRPRERLARHGSEALANRELLALLLGTGVRGRSALALADDLLASGLRGLAGCSLPDLEGRHGLGRAKASRLLAALELGSRLASEGPQAAPF